MHILALNAGSSSLKYRLFQMGNRSDELSEVVLAEGNVEHVGGETTGGAAEKAIRDCMPAGIDAVGHRIVHGGPDFVAPTLLTAETRERLRAITELAPLHIPINLAVIEAGIRLLPNVPAVGVFDTAFHRTLPEVATTYALPTELCQQNGLRRYGFHGISHRYVSEKLRLLEGDALPGKRYIVCHLGNGASVCAVSSGKSIDTSMGMTPLEGLVMGTRSGDVDPGLLLYLLNSKGITPEQLDDILQHKSGLMGISGQSADVRDLEKAAGQGDVRATLALEVFAYRVRKYIGAYAAALGGLDALALTGGIGEHSAPMRQRICAGLEWFGLLLNNEQNENAQSDTPVQISAPDSRITAWIIPTDEERQIARETRLFLQETTF